MIRLAAFDIAGTTVDDGGAVYEALEAAVRETGASIAATDLQTWMGAEKHEAIAELVRLGGGAPTPELVARQYERFERILAERYRAEPPVPVDGALETITELRRRGVKVALTTGFDAPIADIVLGAVGWSVGGDGAVDAVITADQVVAGRPAPYLIQHAMEATGTTDVRTVVAAGDTRVDALAGANAGCALTFGVLTGKGGVDAFEGTDAIVLESIVGIPAALRERGLID